MQLEIKNLTKNYGSFPALRDFSIVLNAGVYGLLGPNGAGKSTLANIICETLKPTSGEILYDGTPIKAMGKEYRGLLGFAPQVGSYYKDFKTGYFLEYMGMLKEIGTKAQIRSRVGEVLELVNLTEVSGKKIGALSGGMKQRVGIAQALLNDPKILILDEPTAGLDPKERIRLRNILSQMSFDRITILATHIVSDIEYISDQVLLLKKGELLRKGTPEEILADMHGKVYKAAIPKSEVDSFYGRYKIANVTKDGDRAELRIVSDTPPEAGEVVPAEPCLEDAYLYYFDEIGAANEVSAHA